MGAPPIVTVAWTVMTVLTVTSASIDVSQFLLRLKKLLNNFIIFRFYLILLVSRNKSYICDSEIPFWESDTKKIHTITWCIVIHDIIILSLYFLIFNDLYSFHCKFVLLNDMVIQILFRILQIHIILFWNRSWFV